ncbi:MAG: DUF1501 domain-containing protein [Gemmataceae bacterium]|nr:DUF1501 domain-containing protein [Gemmataceae bacterium]
MWTLLGSPRRTCDVLTRRETLKVGALSALGGFGLPQLLHAEARRPANQQARAKNVIVLYLLGGAATQDMWDQKPNAPAEIRGEFRPAATSVPGIQICEHLPRMARWMHRSAIVRSVNHRAGCHNTLPSYTGYEVALPDITTTRDTYPPSMGSVVEYFRQHRPELLPARRGESLHELPSYVYLPCYLGWGQAIRRPGPYAGFLGQRHDPLFTECSPFKDPADAAPTPGHPRTVHGVPFLSHSTLGPNMTIDRLDARQSLVQQVDRELRRADGQPALAHFGRTQQRAFDILTSSRVRAAFDIANEDPRLVDRYGRNLFGQSALIGRRLIEAGCRFINVTWDLYWDRVQIDYDAWDTHNRNFPILRENKLPGLDQTYSALMEDLHNRGLLDETLVVIMSEMGRTPRINGNGGRDHWTFCYSVWLAGAGIRGGTVYGASDAQAAYVKDLPASTGDICATIFEALGIDPHTMVPDRSGRPMPIANGGNAISDILG